jgi:Family of unknown function (DUF5681)
VKRPCNSPVPESGIQEYQSLAPDLFSSRARGARGRFAKGVSGNPAGRPRGIPNPRRRPVELVIRQAGPEAMAHLVEKKRWLLRPLALRLLPPPRSGPPQPDLSRLRTAEDFRQFLSEAWNRMARGEISPAEAAQLARRARRRLRALKKERRLARRLRRIGGMMTPRHQDATHP